MCVFHDHSITADPYCALCALSTPNNAMCIVVTNNTAEQYFTSFDGDVYVENQHFRVVDVVVL
jgi:hypothetical protein